MSKEEKELQERLDEEYGTVQEVIEEFLEETKTSSQKDQEDLTESFPIEKGKRKEREEFGLCQWAKLGQDAFIPTGKTIKRIPPGVYEIHFSQNSGIFFQKISTKTEGLIRFPQTNSEKVIEEIQKFWSKEDLFKKYDLAYKRGILLWGPPGSGKSCTAQLLIKDVIDRGGIVINFTNVKLFLEGFRKFRVIQPDTPIVVLMEDIESIIRDLGESEVLNVLDGVNEIRKVVFLATTNYPEKLGARIVNRPSRFDKRFKIGHPNKESRKLYFKYLLKDEIAQIDLEKWVNDTEEYSLAHLKELFIAVRILGDDYTDAIKTLNKMREKAKSEASEEFSEKKVGFELFPIQKHQRNKIRSWTNI